MMAVGLTLFVDIECDNPKFLGYFNGLVGKKKRKKRKKRKKKELA